MKLNDAASGQQAAQSENQNNTAKKIERSKFSFARFKKGAIRFIRRIGKYIPFFRKNQNTSIATSLRSRTASTLLSDTKKESHPQYPESNKSNSSTASTKKNKIKNWKNNENNNKDSAKTLKEIENGLKSKTIASETKLEIDQSRWQELVNKLNLKELQKLLTNEKNKHGMLSADKNYHNDIRKPAIARLGRVEASRLEAYYSDKNLEERMNIARSNLHFAKDKQILQSIEDESINILNSKKSSTAIFDDREKDNSKQSLETFNIIKEGLTTGKIATKTELRITNDEWQELLDKLNSSELTYLVTNRDIDEGGMLASGTEYADDIRAPAVATYARVIASKLIAYRPTNLSLEKCMDDVRVESTYTKDTQIRKAIEDELKSIFDSKNNTPPPSEPN